MVKKIQIFYTLVILLAIEISSIEKHSVAWFSSEFNQVKNVTLELDTKSLADISKYTYEILIPCLKDNQMMKGKSTDNWKLPDDAEAHYTSLLLATEKYRNIVPHEAAGYHGPWIENHFISYFMNKPLSFFRGLIPLFIQWVDIHVYDIDLEPNQVRNTSIPDHKNIHEEVAKLLRTDVIYFAVSQDDQGIFRLSQLRPNILVFSAGGCGHIPIPLIKEEYPYIPPPVTFEWDIGFYGNLRPRLSRSRMLYEIKERIDFYKMKNKFGGGPSWKEDISNTKLNLAPRGFGRTSYRLAEIVNMGRIPVYLYDDVEWLPYAHTNISVTEFGFVGKMGSLRSLVDKLKKLSNEEIRKKLDIVKSVRDYYTYVGVLHQIELFLIDPLGKQGGYLRCTRFPNTDKR